MSAMIIINQDEYNRLLMALSASQHLAEQLSLQAGAFLEDLFAMRARAQAIENECRDLVAENNDLLTTNLMLHQILNQDAAGEIIR